MGIVYTVKEHWSGVEGSFHWDISKKLVTQLLDSLDLKVSQRLGIWFYLNIYLYFFVALGIYILKLQRACL